MTDFIALERRYEFDVYPKREIVIVKGQNARLWDDRGREYIDCVAGHGVANLGHGNEAVLNAITEQAARLITCSGVFFNDTRALFLEKLLGIAPRNLTRAFLCNSGTESVEAAIKFARFTTRKTDFVSAVRGFHGRTLGALSATFNPKYRDDFQPLIPGFVFAPFNNFEKLAEKITDRTAGVILEIVQGEGGVYVGNEAYFRAVQDLCRRKEVLLILDEVQTGFCRTGKMFAVEHFGLEPDMMCLAKSIAGGIPMGAVLCADAIRVPEGKHGSTFGGNPLASAAGIAAIDYMTKNRLDEQARDKGNSFVERLKLESIPLIQEIRHLGLMIGIELKEKVKPYIEALMTEGVLALPAGPSVLRLLPPLTIPEEDLERVREKLLAVLRHSPDPA